jgi:sulfite reductase beta subunit-like hemoprotein
MFKWTGIYQQLQKGFFMLRVRVPGGLLGGYQLAGIARIADEFAQAKVSLTTRQTVQFHFLRKEDLPLVLDALSALGLDSKNACGDVVRNVVTCPLQGICPHEVGDVRDVLLSIANDEEIKDRQRNLPRKHKISVAGCGRACGQTLMNCQGWFPVHGEGIQAPRGFRYHAGGGLGARPYLAKEVFEWVPEELVLPVTRAAVELHRRHGDRRVRARARLKIVVDQWGARRFGEAILERLRELGVPNVERIRLARRSLPQVEESILRGQSVVPQRQRGYSAVRIIVPRGEIKSALLRTIADLSRQYGDGGVLLTARQNLLFRFVPDDQVSALVQDLKALGFDGNGLDHAVDAVACVGTTVCNLAVSDTPAAWRALTAALADSKLSQRAGPLRIHLNGCPNSCAQHWIADIGLRGLRRAGDAGSEEGFALCVGGSLEGAGRIARPLCEVPSSEVARVVVRLLELFVERRSSDRETFHEFVERAGLAELASWLGEVPAPPEPLNARNLRLMPHLRSVVEEAAHAKR